MTRRLFLAGSVAAAACGQQQPDIPFVCPMDPEVRSTTPGRCPRCGMKLVAGIPEPREFEVDLKLSPEVPRPGERLRLHIRPRDPKTGKAAKLQLVHEKLLHLFLVSGDLSFFVHQHPEQRDDGWFDYDCVLPLSAEYRLLFDFYPEGTTPQLIAKTLYVSGNQRTYNPPPEQSNLKVSLRTDPEEPLAGTKTMMFFKLSPSDGVEPYLGAWGHMLCASSDLIDLIHTHPAWDDRSDTIQFNLIFPRPGVHRVWVQFQRLGVVNTAAFSVPVAAI